MGPLIAAQDGACGLEGIMGLGGRSVAGLSGGAPATARCPLAKAPKRLKPRMLTPCLAHRSPLPAYRQSAVSKCLFVSFPSCCLHGLGRCTAHPPATLSPRHPARLPAPLHACPSTTLRHADLVAALLVSAHPLSPTPQSAGQAAPQPTGHLRLIPHAPCCAAGVLAAGQPGSHKNKTPPCTPTTAQASHDHSLHTRGGEQFSGYGGRAHTVFFSLARV